MSNGTVYDFYTAPQNNFIGSGYLIDVKINSVSATSSVLMANGTYAPITALKTGESVYGYNATTHQPTTGTVTAVGSRLATTEYVINGVLQVDPEAYLLVNGVRTSVQDLKVGDTVQLGNGATVRVSSIRLLHGIFLVYDVGTTSGSYVVNGYVIE